MVPTIFNHRVQPLGSIAERDGNHPVVPLAQCRLHGPTEAGSFIGQAYLYEHAVIYLNSGRPMFERSTLMHPMQQIPNFTTPSVKIIMKTDEWQEMIVITRLVGAQLNRICTNDMMVHMLDP